MSKKNLSRLSTIRTFMKVGTCSETLCNVLNRAYDVPLEAEEHASLPLAGGIMQHGYQCGQLWGASLAAGAEAYRQLGAGAEAETAAIQASTNIVDSFRSMTNHINCMEITDIDLKSSDWRLFLYFLLKGGVITCFHMAAKFAPVAKEAIDKSLESRLDTYPEQPVSCASLVAEKMGASEFQKTMASGFAGGIGLCGGACGALGAAIWMTIVKQNETTSDSEVTIQPCNTNKKKKGMEDYKNPEVVALIERFLKSSDCEFECSEIAGRKFENVQDHASYLKEGGCTDLIDSLAGEKK